MNIFHKFNKIYTEIDSEEQFNVSQFSGSEEMLLCSWDKLIVSSDKEEELSELYYLIEDCGEFIRCEDNMMLYDMSDVKIVLYDDYDSKAIIINQKDKDNLESFI